MNYKITTLLAAFTLTAHAALPIPDYAAANLVLGQTDFTSKLAPTPPNATSLAKPSSVVIDPVTRKVFVSDQFNNRVLRYASAEALADGAAAEMVLGQASFTTSVAASPPTSTSMKSPGGLFLDRLGRLWVADSGNHRVLMFASASAIGSGSSANRVFGQPSFATATQATSIQGMYTPTGVWVDANDRLWIADSNNHRVLRFDAISNKLSGANADGVLGQSTFTTNNTGTGAAGLKNPAAIAVSTSGTLFVADGTNNRVLRYNNAAALGNGAAASAVLGQADLTSTGTGLSAVQMNTPQGVTITPDDSLWVSDFANNRVIRFDQASSKPSGSAASGVIGQPNFGTNAATTTTQGLSSPAYGPFVDTTGSLWVADDGNHRVLRFPAPAPVVVPPVVVIDKTAPLLVLSTKIPKLVTKPQLLLKGTASDASGIKSVQYRLGKAALKTAKGTTTWQIKLPLNKGKNTLTLLATDTTGNVSLNKVIKITRK
jgi:sugar lactone lactonase YvrE